MIDLMHPPNLIALAIPGFFVLIALELAYDRYTCAGAYRFHDSIANLSCGVASQVSALFISGLIYGLYHVVWAEARLLTLPVDHWATWVFAFVYIDFAYYWWHRHSHEVNLLWAAHIVHHHSEDYNLAVALRQSMITTVTSIPYYLPLAVMGVHMYVFVPMLAVSTLYQFWIHTRFVPELGPLEYIFNTASAHRVHHGINPRYLDKNYAAAFIVWDRLFGTYERETEPVVYGTVEPLRSFNPLWANIEYPVKLIQEARTSRDPLDMLRIWFMPPAWRPASAGGPVEAPPVSPETFVKYNPSVTGRLALYTAIQFAVVSVGLDAMLHHKDELPFAVFVVPALLVLAGLASWGGLVERKTWALPLEAARLVGTGVWATFFVWGGAFAVPIVAAVWLAVIASLLGLAAAAPRGAPRADTAEADAGPAGAPGARA